MKTFFQSVLARWHPEQKPAETSWRDGWLATLPPLLFGLSLSAPFLLAAIGRRLVIGGATSIPPTQYADAMVTIFIGVAVLDAGALIAVGSACRPGRQLLLWRRAWTSAAAMVP